MFKVILFITLGLTALVIINKLVSFFIKDSFHKIYFICTTNFFIYSFVFIYREKTFKNYKGIYEPPRFNGEKVIPGKVVDE